MSLIFEEIHDIFRVRRVEVIDCRSFLLWMI